ncbi:MAG TPA: complex I NDUFA9 subunit family protein [Xanthobacteraceae bacterium]|nr:complex I NDUFA9 subunit family protein [Xanthobacteraceae bacterium]
MTETPTSNDRLVTIYGGSGFVGRHAVRAFAQRGWRIRVAVRRPELAFHLQPLGRVGQIHAVQANLRYPDSVARALEDAEVAINLVGILYERGRQSFEAVQAAGAGAVAKAAAAAGTRLVHVSAIGADARSASGYARSKAAGEKAVSSAIREAVILRPSVVFGQEDDFFNRFAELARWLPALPLIGDGKTRFQPVFVGDVAAAIVAAAEERAPPATVYELGGPEVKTFRELLELMLRVIGRGRLLVPLPFALARLQAFFLEFLPKPPLTRDQVRLLERDNVVSPKAEREGRTLKGLGFAPTSLEAILPSYLWRFRKTGQYARSAV